MVGKERDKKECEKDQEYTELGRAQIFNPDGGIRCALARHSLGLGFPGLTFLTAVLGENWRCVSAKSVKTQPGLARSRSP
jgi:hypothetical protein